MNDWIVEFMLRYRESYANWIEKANEHVNWVESSSCTTEIWVWGEVDLDQHVCLVLDS